MKPKRLRLRGKERVLFVKRAALYLRAGIPILETFDLIYASSNSRSQKYLLQQLIEDVKDGMTLSQALSRFPRVYTALQLQIISAGELSGTLSESLSTLARMLDERAQRIRTIIGMLAYPAILFFGAISVSLFLLLYIFPKIVPIFRGLHAELPLTTRILIGLSSILQTYWLLLLLAVVTFLFFSAWFVRLPRIRKSVDPFMLKIPLFGKLLRIAVVCFTFRTVATLLSSGTRLDEAIRLATESTTNTACRAALIRIRFAVLAGSKLSVALGAESFLFPPVALQLVSVGEMTGTLSQSIASAAHILEEELSDQMRFLTALLEPLIMITMGFVIGFIALAIISPMYGITQSLST